MVLRAFLHRSACCNVSFALYQCSFKLTFKQVVLLRHVHDLKPIFATYRDGGLGVIGQHRFNGGYAAHFEVVGCELCHSIMILNGRGCYSQCYGSRCQSHDSGGESQKSPRGGQSTELKPLPLVSQIQMRLVFARRSWPRSTIHPSHQIALEQFDDLGDARRKGTRQQQQTGQHALHQAQARSHRCTTATPSL